jgi:hypothetical protein
MTVAKRRMRTWNVTIQNGIGQVRSFVVDAMTERAAHRKATKIANQQQISTIPSPEWRLLRAEEIRP